MNFDVACAQVMAMKGRRDRKLQRVERQVPRGPGRQGGGPALGQVVNTCRALGHPLRVSLVAFLCSAPRGGAYVCELVAYLQRAQPTVSHHLKVLVRAGVVKCEPRGTWAWYQVVPERLAQLSQQLADFIAVPVAPAGAG
ncbi:MAG: ArsR/SmtB family transcription factor [Acidimicrobiales bacterium]